MNQLGLLYIYTWKCHKETPWVATFISNNLKSHFLNLFSLFFYEIEEQECGTGPAHAGRLAPVGGER
jgi:hypothetical protein